MATPEGTTTKPSNKLPGPLDIAHFDFGVTLGTGSFGRVRFATHKATGSFWAIKILKKAEIIRLQQVEHMISEKTILMCLDHPFIVNLAGTFQDAKCLYMVLEYVIGGEFFTHLRKAGRFDFNTTKFYATQVVSIFEYLHSQDFIYRDLKPENLLLDHEGFLKITDFGFAKRVAFKTYTLCGTPEYIAPEVLLNKGHGKGVDWWTMGILIYEMLAGQPPFCDDDPMGIYQQILSGKINFPRYFDRNAKALIKRLLTADLTKRYGCLKNGVEDIKKHKFFSGVDWDAMLARKGTAPIIPKVVTPNDTSNFDPYPDSNEEAPVPVYNGKDPFAEF
ncbi:AGC/PKA protein kinase [Saprolegnia parasitica CBS 223.65]|uniref:AGC/PKA protein kinase n=1 Tax=Saprolegnia parasitica (strain CBS 223.65) TaxID=695850 RepID=A0A067CVS1_SAPPC|nr:AGC/PKA protein kinase [Saprolegnia parasitica CBS 223.65]KDO34603.1 AGC/PKA protein kinase [Saprolegnia parasitica CBS 223.65]|eukprot:XP_012194280.1 AGC/PKA protein kinase [Saprolegnia parasitica CBS 223.65]